MKRLFTVIGCSVLLVAMVCACGNRKKSSEEQKEEDTMTETNMSVWDNLPEEPVFDIVTTMGTIRVKLYADTPNHRDNFVNLAKQGFYEGILFHRVIKDFMIQTGDPLTKDASKANEWGTGGPGYTVKAEIVPEHHHKKGALAAARRGDAANPMKASSGSQFYIVQSEAGCSHLDGQYTIFGETIDGFEVIDKIADVTVDNRDRPLIGVKILKIAPVKNKVEIENNSQDLPPSDDNGTDIAINDYE